MIKKQIAVIVFYEIRFFYLTIKIQLPQSVFNVFLLKIPLPVSSLCLLNDLSPHHC